MRSPPRVLSAASEAGAAPGAGPQLAVGRDRIGVLERAAKIGFATPACTSFSSFSGITTRRGETFYPGLPVVGVVNGRSSIGWLRCGHGITLSIRLSRGLGPSSTRGVVLQAAGDQFGLPRSAAVDEHDNWHARRDALVALIAWAVRLAALDDGRYPWSRSVGYRHRTLECPGLFEIDDEAISLPRFSGGGS